MNQSQRVLVAGTGISGIAAAKLVLERGGDVVLYDGNAALKEEDIKEKFDRDAKVTVVLGENQAFRPAGRGAVHYQPRHTA